jgi:hypothetical protein
VYLGRLPGGSGIGIAGCGNSTLHLTGHRVEALKPQLKTMLMSAELALIARKGISALSRKEWWAVVGRRTQQQGRLQHSGYDADGPNGLVPQ